MKRFSETLVFFVLITLLLALRFRVETSGVWLYSAVVEDPASAFSLLPWDALAVRELHGGHFPLWNDLSGTGMPLLANLQSSPANPMKWPFYLFFEPLLLELMLILRLALAGTFAFLLVREMGRSRTAAALGGTAFAFSGYFMKQFNMVNVASEMWLPLLIYFLLRERREGPRARRLIAAALVWALVLTGGNPEAAFYTSLLALAFMFWIAGRERIASMSLASFALPFCLGAIIASIQILPFIEYLPQSFHIHDENLSRMVTFPAKLVSSLAAPWLTGPHGTILDQKLSAPHVGMAVFALALGAAIHPRRLSRPAWFFAAAATLLLALVYSAPPLNWLSRVPPFSISGNQKFAMAGASLCFAVLAAFGLDLLAARGFRSRGFSPAIAIAAALLIGGALAAKYDYARFDRGGFFVPFIALSCTGAAAVIRGKKSALRGSRVAAALIVLAAWELFTEAHGYRFNAPFDRFSISLDPEKNRHTHIGLLGLENFINEPGKPRFTAPDGFLHPNNNLFEGMPDIRAFEGMYPRRYVKAMGEIEGFGLGQAVENFISHGWMFDIRIQNLGHPLVDLMGVKYVPGVMEKVCDLNRVPLSECIDDPEKGPVHAPGFEIETFDFIKARCVIRGGVNYCSRFYVNRDAYPRAWTESDDNDKGPAMIENYFWDRVEISASGPGVLVLADTHFPGWEAEVDGRAIRIKPHLDLFRKVALGPGEHEVRFIYRPVAFRIGLSASLAGLFAAAGFCFWAAKKHG